MADTILEQIAQKIKTELLELKTAGTVVDVVRPVRYGRAPSFVHTLLILEQGAERIDEEVTNPSYGLLYRVQRFRVICCVSLDETSTDAVDGHINNLVGNVQKKLMENRTWDGLASDTIILPVTPFPSSATIDGAWVDVDVHYRVAENNPFAQA